MKTAVKFILHTLLGFRNYLFYFSRYKIRTLKNDERESDFFYFLRLLPDGGTVLDIGANIGIMTVHLARNPGRKVFAFEPIPYNIDTLKRIVNHYKIDNVRILEIALGNTDGKIEMVVPMVGNVRMQGLSHVIHESIQDRNEGEKFTAEIRRLDSISELGKEVKITGIKMDVENFEYYVLEGGLELIRRHLPILYIELWNNENRKHCFRLLKSLGYSIQVVDQGALVLYDALRHKHQNFIFVPEGMQTPEKKE